MTKKTEDANMHYERITLFHFHVIHSIPSWLECSFISFNCFSFFFIHFPFVWYILETHTIIMHFHQNNAILRKRCQAFFSHIFLVCVSWNRLNTWFPLNDFLSTVFCCYYCQTSRKYQNTVRIAFNFQTVGKSWHIHQTIHNPNIHISTIRFNSSGFMFAFNL